MYEVTKNGFLYMVMGYTGEKAGKFKEKFVTEFDKHKSLLKNDDYIISRVMSVLNDQAKALEQQVSLGYIVLDVI
jgi:phage regulator Rha-like protein